MSSNIFNRGDLVKIDPKSEFVSLISQDPGLTKKNINDWLQFHFGNLGPAENKTLGSVLQMVLVATNDEIGIVYSKHTDLRGKNYSHIMFPSALLRLTNDTLSLVMKNSQYES